VRNKEHSKHTHQADHKLEKRPRIQTGQDAGRKIDLIHPSPYTYNVTNMVQLANDLIDIPYDHNIKFASFDINGMYSNIPITDLMTTLRKLCEVNNVDDRTTQDIMRIAQTLVLQNYFRFRDTIYIQNEGLAMGAPTSSILSEVYLQYMENTTVYELLIKLKVEDYFRYVDNILVMYKDDKNIHRVLEDFNNLIPNMKFTLEKEYNKINFLDITITKNHADCYDRT